MEKKKRNRKVNKIRTSLSLDIEVRKILDEYSEATGMTRSDFVNDCIKQAVPNLKRLIAVMTYMKANPMAKQHEVEAMFNEVIESAEIQVEELKNQAKD